MIKRHWDGVIDAVLTKVTNARSEATNAKIQWTKRPGCGFRNRERFRNAIYFHWEGSTSTRTPGSPTRIPEAAEYLTSLQSPPSLTLTLRLPSPV